MSVKKGHEDWRKRRIKDGNQKARIRKAIKIVEGFGTCVRWKVNKEHVPGNRFKVLERIEEEEEEEEKVEEKVE